MGLASVNLTQFAPKVKVCCGITCSDGHWIIVQGHSRSRLLVPIESPYATSIGEMNNINLYPASHCFWVIAMH